MWIEVFSASLQRPWSADVTDFTGEINGQSVTGGQGRVLLHVVGVDSGKSYGTGQMSYMKYELVN